MQKNRDGESLAKRPGGKKPPGLFVWVSAVKISKSAHCRFKARCIELGMKRTAVVQKLITGFANKSIDL